MQSITTGLLSSLLLVGGLLWAPPMYAADVPLEELRQEQGVTVDIYEQSLEEMIHTSVQAVALERTNTAAGTTVQPVAQLVPGEYQLQSVRRVGLASDDLPVESSQEILVTGQAPPAATAIVRLADGRVAYQVESDSSGQWAVAIPIQDLPAGIHSGSVQYESQGVSSAAIPFAEFDIQQVQIASTQTWMFVLVSGAALLLLLVLVNIVLYRDRKMNALQQFSPDPALLALGTIHTEEEREMVDALSPRHINDGHQAIPL